MTTHDIHYPIEFTSRLEILWGDGFLSPGGAEEVKHMLQGLDLRGKSVLDIGCGTGGVETVLLKDLAAGRVTAIDVEPQLVERTRQRMRDSGYADRVEVMLVKPGPLDFADASFDVVFSKDSMIHIPDKHEIFQEVLRVLRPGGVFAASDWLVGENALISPEWKRLMQLTHLSFEPATAETMMQAMQTAGFERVSSTDRNSWYAPVTVDEVRQLEGPLRERILEVVDEDTYRHWLEVRKALRDATGAGHLRPTHLRGFNPD